MLTATVHRLDDAVADWQRVTEIAAQGDPFQTLAWLQAQQECYGTSVSVIIVEDAGDVVGGQAVVARPLLGRLRGYEGIGGPLAARGKDTEVLQAVVAAFRDQLPRGLYQAMRPQALHDLGQPLIAEGFRESSLSTFIVDLDRPENDLWAALDGNARTGVRKGEKEGVEVAESNDWETWADLGELHREHAAGAGILALSAEELRYFHDTLLPAAACRLFVSRIGGEIAAGMMFIVAESSMLYFVAASRNDMLLHSPNDPIMWHAMCWGRENGIKVLDLYDTDPRPDSPLYGIHRFKAKWGGELVDRPFYIRGKLYYWLREWKRRSAGRGIVFSLMRRLGLT